MHKKNKVVVERFVREWLQNRNHEILPEVCHVDIRFDWGALGSGHSIQQLREREESAREAFPDLQIRTRLLVAEGDVVINISQVAGTHTGWWLGLAPTGTRLTWSAAEIYQLSDGRISSQQLIEDWLTLFVAAGVAHP
jgi:predicted ester cyclase